MALIDGQVESLKKLKDTLNLKGIDRFSSIRDINLFLDGYDKELRSIDTKVEADFLKELEELKQQHNIFDDFYSLAIETETNKLLRKIDNLRSKVAKKGVHKLWTWFYRLELKKLEKNSDTIIKQQLIKEKQQLERLKTRVIKLQEKKRIIIEKRVVSERFKLEQIKSIVEELSPLIAGAIGESLVSKELQKLSNDYILINDFSRTFNPPIYNKREQDRIFSIQIDHLLISRSGVFILETKNWSERSLKNISLRSPVEQIRRVSFALFVLLNGNNNSANKINLKKHHWGERQIPIRNVIVMINNKPKESFKYIQVKRLDELVNYVEYFEPIMSKEETNSIYEYFKNI